jgi:formate hydrogenlyase transcriptional activator
LHELLKVLGTDLDETSLLVAAEAVLRALIPFDRYALMMFDERAGSRRVLSVVGSFPPQHYEAGAEIRRDLKSHAWQAFDQKRCVIREDLERHRPLPMDRLLYREGLRSLSAAPLMVNGTAIGTLNFGSREAEAYTEQAAPLIEDFAAHFAPVIAHRTALRKLSASEPDHYLGGPSFENEIPLAQGPPEMVGRSVRMRQLIERVHSVAGTSSTILITGETGTGKGLVARAIHRLSPRQSKPFVRVNCAAIPSGLFESELLGHEKGSFTGAVQTRIGRFELANGGTIFLDEIGELPLDVQAKLLCVLQDRVVERVGGTIARKVDVRVIAAANRKLEDEVVARRFREDLYYRLKVIPIEVPSLRERREDIPLWRTTSYNGSARPPASTFNASILKHFRCS